MPTEIIRAKKISPWKSFKNIRRLFNNPIELINEQFETYGSTYKTNLSFQEIYITRDANCIQHFMQKNHRSYKKTKLNAILGKSLGNGLLTSDGDYWLRQRRLIQPGFHKKKLEELSNIIINDINQFSEELTSTTQQNKPVDLTKWMMKLTINVVLNSLYSSNISSKQINRIDEIITAIQHYIVAQIRVPFSKTYFTLNGKNRQIKSMLKEIDEVLYGIIKERRQQANAHNDLLDMLLNSRYEDTGEGMSDQQLRDESLIILVAGHETSAVALTWTFYLLSQHPEIEQKVLIEIEQALQNRQPCFEDLKNLTYTKQVIQEAMRLYPPAWIVDREAREDNMMEDYQVKKGEVINAFIYGLHHNPAYWQNPHIFMPARFESEKHKARHPFSYMPFGAGPRLCIGNNFALMEMQFALAILLPKFKITPVSKKPPELEPLVTLRPKGGLPVQVTLR